METTIGDVAQLWKVKSVLNVEMKFTLALL